MQEAGIPCPWTCGGTSKGACLLAADLLADPEARDALLLDIIGSRTRARSTGSAGRTS